MCRGILGVCGRVRKSAKLGWQATALSTGSDGPLADALTTETRAAIGSGEAHDSDVGGRRTRRHGFRPGRRRRQLASCPSLLGGNEDPKLPHSPSPPTSPRPPLPLAVPFTVIPHEPQIQCSDCRTRLDPLAPVRWSPDSTPWPTFRRTTAAPPRTPRGRLPRRRAPGGAPRFASSAGTARYVWTTSGVWCSVVGVSAIDRRRWWWWSPRPAQGMKGRPAAGSCSREHGIADRPQVRCDGTPGGCENCKRLHFECSLSEAASADGRRSLTQLERRRVRRACIACRDRKSKCTGSYPSCVRCLRLGIDCQYPSAARGGGVVGASSHGMAPRGSGGGGGSNNSASRDAHPSQGGDASLSPSMQRTSVAQGSTPSSAASPALSFTS